ncbi:nicotinamidase-related amidase [Streptomyces sp. TE12347]
MLVGIQTNMCVETTARMAGNLGYDVLVPLDATHTFDLAGPEGLALTADELARATAVNLQGGGFARVTTTAALLG